MTASATHPFHLRKPCAECPFRTDLPTGPYLRHDRARGIADGLRRGATFHCHKTTVEVDDGEGDVTLGVGPRSQACAGALVTMMREGYYAQDVRMAIGFGWFDPTRLDMDSPVHPSLSAWVAAHREAGDVTYEHCGKVLAGCLDPPGWMGNGGVVHNDDDPTCHPVDDACTVCGATMCDSCREQATTSRYGLVCPDCGDDEDQDDDG